ncbi:hypothetical protein HYU11_04095 [Candidatus Woesearchaeota archaeon]|nr:hypothetical protein [Candidatus Woesearchaeota archaeon]
MNVTTVKIHYKTKFALDELKKDNETYDEIISGLIKKVKKMELKKELITGYKSLGKSNLETLKEWEPASSEFEEW